MTAYDSNGNEINVTSTLEQTDKKCPNCGGIMNFDPATGGLLCPFCDYKQAIEEGEEVEEQDFDDVENTGNCNWGVKTKVVICKSCGAETVYDALQTSGECPYCGSNQVMEAFDKDTLAPNGVVPFKIDEKIAERNFNTWIRMKVFAPRAAKKTARANSFKGFYLPYWTFDADTTTAYTGRYGIDHTHRDSKGNTHTETSWYPTAGVYKKFIDDELVVATDRYDEKMLKSINPFNTKASVAYSPEYITGFVSERYSRGLKAAWNIAKNQIKSRLRSGVEQQIRYEHFADHVQVLTMNTIYKNKTYKYLMLPVWTSSFKYKNKVYQFNVNGQTGKVGGKAPVSPFKVALAVLAGIIVAALILYVLIMGE